MPQIKKITGTTADVFLEYIQRNLPEGVTMSVYQVSRVVFASVCVYGPGRCELQLFVIPCPLQEAFEALPSLLLEPPAKTEQTPKGKQTGRKK